MAGIIIPIIPKQIFTFTHLPSTTTKTFVLHNALNAVPYTSGRLLVRVHDRNMTAAQTFAVSIYGTNPSAEDPSEFTDTTATLMNVPISSGTSAPSLQSAATTTIFPYLKVLFTAFQNTGGTAFMLELSADLLLREG